MEVCEPAAIQPIEATAPNDFEPLQGLVWAEVPLIAMVPGEYRDDVAAIVEQDPEKAWILRRCKWAEIDCWTALELLGIPLRTDTIH